MNKNNHNFPNPADYEIRVGDKRIFMTAAFHWVGVVVKETPTSYWLDKCSFVDLIGHMSAIHTGKLKNSEYVGNFIEVKRGAYITSLPWTAPLPEADVKND